MADKKEPEKKSSDKAGSVDKKQTRGKLPRWTFYIVLALLIALGVLVWRDLQTRGTEPTRKFTSSWETTGFREISLRLKCVAVSVPKIC